MGDVAARIGLAVDRMCAWPCVTRARMSSLYRTAPVGPVADQPWFVNAVALLSVSSTDAHRFFASLVALEHDLGRERTVAQGPRTIDLDLLAFGDTVCDTPALTLPHPRMLARAFVLVPLAEITGDAFVVAGHPLRVWLARPALAAQDIQRWDEPTICTPSRRR